MNHESAILIRRAASPFVGPEDDQMAKRGRPALPVKTESTRVFAPTAKALQEIARLEGTNLATVVDRYLNKSQIERDLSAVRKRELTRLTELASAK